MLLKYATHDHLLYVNTFTLAWLKIPLWIIYISKGTFTKVRSGLYSEA